MAQVAVAAKVLSRDRTTQARLAVQPTLIPLERAVRGVDAQVARKLAVDQASN
jgi:hypothetical protein